ncbi:MAG: flavin reductase family protein, partial [Halobacteriota archaeon]
RRFEPISAMDSKSLLKPHVPLLVVTAADDRGPNVMTAAWWMLAGYRPFRYLLAVDRKTFTHELIEANPEFVLAVPTEDLIDAVAYCGSVSGRDVDKIETLDLGVNPALEVDVPTLDAALGNIECRVDESFTFGENTYYFGEVAAATVRSGMLDGRVLRPAARPLAYMGSDRRGPADEKYRYRLAYADDLERVPDAELFGDDGRVE